jgi:O-methyltransferase
MINMPSYAPSVQGDLLSRTNLFRWVREWARFHQIEDFYYMEFGLLNGESIIDAVRQLRVGLKYVYGFDSFEGLPAHSQVDLASGHLAPAFQKGSYKGLSEQEVRNNIVLSSRIPTENLILTPGFFDISLPKFDKNQLSNSGFPLLFYLDCDLYSSTVEVLNFISDLVQDGSWLLVDDYWCYRGSPKYGQRRAINEWIERTPHLDLSPYSNFRGFGRAFIVNKS